MIRPKFGRRSVRARSSPLTTVERLRQGQEDRENPDRTDDQFQFDRRVARVTRQRFGDDFVAIGAERQQRENGHAERKIDDEILELTIDRGKRVIIVRIGDGTERNAEQNEEKIAHGETDDEQIRHRAQRFLPKDDD